MKKKLLVLVFFLFLIPSIGKAGEEGGIKINGYKWDESPTWWKLGFVEGWREGGSAGMVNMAKVSFFRCDLISGKTDEMVDTASKAGGFDLELLTLGQVIETIDNIYSDPRIKTWGIDEIMPLVRGRLKGGWTEKDLDEVIAYKIKTKEEMKMLWSDLKKNEKMQREGQLSLEEYNKKVITYNMKMGKVLGLSEMPRVWRDIEAQVRSIKGVKK